MKFKFCDLAHYSAMNLEGFLNRYKIRFIKDETGNDKIERTYDITIMNDNLDIYGTKNYVYIGLISEDHLKSSTKIHITDFSELKIF